MMGCPKPLLLVIAIIIILIAVGLQLNGAPAPEELVLYARSVDCGEVSYVEPTPKVDASKLSGLERILVDYWLGGGVHLRDLECYMSGLGQLPLRDKALLALLLAELGDPRAESLVDEAYEVALSSMIPEEVYYAGLILKCTGRQLPERGFKQLSEREAALLAELYPSLKGSVHASEFKARIEALYGDPYEALRLVGDVEGFDEAYTLRLARGRCFLIQLVVEPLVVVLEEPRLKGLRAYDVFGLDVKANATAHYNGSHTTITVETPLGSRTLRFRHLAAPESAEATVKLRSEEGMLRVDCTATHRIEGVAVSLAGDVYQAGSAPLTVAHRHSGRHLVKVEVRLDVDGVEVPLQASGEVNLRQGLTRPFINPSAPLSLAASAAIPLLGCSRKAARAYSACSSAAAALAALLAVGHPVAVYLSASAGATAGLAMLRAWRDLKALSAHLLVMGLLLACSTWTGNPLTLLISGMGNTMMVAALIMYPSEWRTSRKVMLGVNGAYILITASSSVLAEVAPRAAQILAAGGQPAWEAVEAAQALAGSLAAYGQAVPLIVPITYLAQLWWRRSKAKAVEEELAEIVH